MKNLKQNFLLTLVAGSSIINTTFAANTSNPDISANFLGLGQFQLSPYTDPNYKGFTSNGFRLQEAEVQFMSDVDPYFKAVALLSVSQSATGEWGVDPEEVYAETIAVPSAIIRLGKFKAAIGKHNALHTHAYPFIDAPITNTTLLGDEGLNDAGASAAFLLPLPWFSEFTLQAVNAKNEGSFKSPKSGHMVGVGHYKNLWDLSDSSTFEFGLTTAQGKNETLQNTSLYGSDLTYKWRPADGGKYHAFISSLEYLYANRKGLENQEKFGGLSAYIQYQFSERWWIQAREEVAGLQKSDEMNRTDKQSALIAFFPSEFSGFRAQYDHIQVKGADGAEHVASLQYNFTIGAHPAHSY